MAKKQELHKSDKTDIKDSDELKTAGFGESITFEPDGNDVEPDGDGTECDYYVIAIDSDGNIITDCLEWFEYIEALSKDGDLTADVPEESSIDKDLNIEQCMILDSDNYDPKPVVGLLKFDSGDNDVLWGGDAGTEPAGG